MKLLAIIENTIRESIAKKTMIGFFAISNVILIIMLLIALFSDFDINVKLQGLEQFSNGASPLETLVRTMEVMIANLLYMAAIFLSIFATASIMPNTLEKGAIDLLISKPVSRSTILAGKFIGGTLIVFFNVAYYILGMWLIISFRTGYWDGGFLLTVFPITFAFIVLYVFLLFIGVTTRSSALGIILAYGFLIILSPLLAKREVFLYAISSSEAYRGIVDVLYYILPKPDDISSIMNNVILHSEINWMPVWSSAIFAGVLYGFTQYIFNRKDF